MTDESARRASPKAPASRGRRYKPQSLALADGSKLVLRADGSIEHLDAQGASAESWTPDQSGWADEAIRFGLHSQTPTVAPHGRVPGTRPPRR